MKPIYSHHLILSLRYFFLFDLTFATTATTIIPRCSWLMRWLLIRCYFCCSIRTILVDIQFACECSRYETRFCRVPWNIPCQLVVVSFMRLLQGTCQGSCFGIIDEDFTTDGTSIYISVACVAWRIPTSHESLEDFVTWESHQGLVISVFGIMIFLRVIHEASIIETGLLALKIYELFSGIGFPQIPNFDGLIFGIWT